MDALKQMVANLDEAIEHEYLADLGYTENYKILVQERQLLLRSIRKLEALERKRVSAYGKIRK